MKYYLLILALFYSFFTKGQGLFDNKYDNCAGIKPCLYCGDTIATPTQNLVEYIKWRLEHAPYGYDKAGIKIIYEIYIDSTGQPCVVSVKDMNYNWSIMDDLRKAINEMKKWHPAKKEGIDISSTVLLQVGFHANWFQVQLITLEEAKKWTKF